MKTLGLGLLTAFVLAIPVRADVFVLDPPALVPFDSAFIGTGSDRGDVFDVLTTFSVASVGIFFDPLTGGATNITANIYAVSGAGVGTLGSLLATASAPVSDGGAAFYDVPIAFDFFSGSRYYLAFTADGATGWGDDINNMRFFSFNYPDAAFTVGNVSVVDGGAFGPGLSGFANSVMPELRLTTGPSLSFVPEPAPAPLVLLALSALGFGIWRKKRIASA
jgi:hypothetical protein